MEQPQKLHGSAERKWLLQCSMMLNYTRIYDHRFASLRTKLRIKFGLEPNPKYMTFESTGVIVCAFS
jgi:hypothetical protein